MVAASDRIAIAFKLSEGQAHDAQPGRDLLKGLQPCFQGSHVLMDRAYEGDETRQLAVDLGFQPVVPPKWVVKAMTSFTVLTVMKSICLI